MRKIEIIPVTKPLQASLTIPGSKSYTLRALLLAALTPGRVELLNPLYSNDTEAMLGALISLGLKIETAPNKIIVHDDITVIKKQDYQINVRDSGVSIRLLLALLCNVPGTKTLAGSQQLNARPIAPLVEGLRQLGAEINYLQNDGFAPLSIASDQLSGHSVRMRGDVSSAYFSALLLIAPLLEGLTVEVEGAQISKPYIDMTLAIMQDWGVLVENNNYHSYQVKPKQYYQQHSYVIEGDYSSAGYFFALAVLTQSRITLTNLNINSKQADVNFLRLLIQMGNTVEAGDNYITFTGKQLLPVQVNMENCPDQVQTMAVLAAFAPGKSVITGVRSLRVKETERVIAVKTELAKMGITTEDTHDTLTIYGGKPQSAIIKTYHDHRMAMAFAIAGAVVPGMQILQPEVVNKSFPEFWQKLAELGLVKL